MLAPGARETGPERKRRSLTFPPPLLFHRPPPSSGISSPKSPTSRSRPTRWWCVHNSLLATPRPTPTHTPPPSPTLQHPPTPQPRQLKETELTEDVAQLQRDNAATVVPALAALAKGIADAKEELSLAQSAAASLAETKADLRKRMERLQTDGKALTAAVAALHIEEGKSAVEPARMHKQIENLDSGLATIGAEVQRLRDAVATRDADLGAQASAVREVNEVRAALEHKLGKHRVDMDNREQEVLSLERALRTERGRHKELLERRVEATGDEERARVASRSAQGELDAANGAYERAKRELKRRLEKLSEAVAAAPPAESEVRDRELDKKRIGEDARRIEAASAATRREMDALIAQYIREESVEKKHRSALAEVAEVCAALEAERDAWHEEEILAHKQITAIKVQREAKGREVEKTVAARKATIESSRMKELELSDLSKQLADVTGRLKQFGSLYDVVKTERNSYAQAIQASQQSTAEMRERLKILKNEVDILQNESGAKDKALGKEQLAFAAASSQRDRE
jgi:chromosome segregation ATPase